MSNYIKKRKPKTYKAVEGITIIENFTHRGCDIPMFAWCLYGIPVAVMGHMNQVHLRVKPKLFRLALLSIAKPYAYGHMLTSINSPNVLIGLTNYFKKYETCKHKLSQLDEGLIYLKKAAPHSEKQLIQDILSIKKPC